jgi:hypothetical protein
MDLSTTGFHSYSIVPVVKPHTVTVTEGNRAAKDACRLQKNRIHGKCGLIGGTKPRQTLMINSIAPLTMIMFATAPESTHRSARNAPDVAIGTISKGKGYRNCLWFFSCCLSRYRIPSSRWA